jgi:hypothetical protein
MMIVLAALLAVAIPNPIQLATGTNTTVTATCRALDGSLGSWERVSGTSATTEPSILDEEPSAKAPPDAMLYCRNHDGGVGKIDAKPESLIYPKGTLLQPVYRLTITRPSSDDQPPFETALGPGGVITNAPFGQAIIFGKHSMLIVPTGWKIASRPVGIMPKNPDAYTSTLDVGGCEVNRMDAEDEYPRYIGTAASDCSTKIDLQTLQ